MFLLVLSLPLALSFVITFAPPFCLLVLTAICVCSLSACLSLGLLLHLALSVSPGVELNLGRLSVTD